MTTITDAYGRTITIAIDQDGEDVYSLAGVTVSFPTGTPQTQAVASIEGMAPADYAPPAPPRLFTFLEFMALFTPAEQAAIVGSNDVNVKLFTLMAAGAAGGLSMSDPRVIAGVNYLVTAGLLTAANAALVLSGQP